MRQRAHLLLTQSPGVSNEYLACSNPPILLHRTPHLTQAGESPDNRGLSRFVPVVVAVSEEENRQTAIHVVCRRSGCVRDSGPFFPCCGSARSGQRRCCQSRPCHTEETNR